MIRSTFYCDAECPGHVREFEGPMPTLAELAELAKFNMEEKS